MLIQDFCPVYWGYLVSFFLLNYRSLYIFWINTFVTAWVAKRTWSLWHDQCPSLPTILSAGSWCAPLGHSSDCPREGAPE